MRDLPPLNALAAFEVVAREGSVRGAAAKLFVTAGAVSRQIRLLEEHFGTELFDRVGRGLVLTATGAAYFERIRHHLDGIRRAGSSMRAETTRTILRLRSYTTFATRWLIPRLSQFQLAEPTIEVRLSMVSDWDDLGDFDAAIRLGGGGWPNLMARPLVPNILIPVCSPALGAGISHTANLLDQTLFYIRARPDDWGLWAAKAGLALDGVVERREFQSSAFAYEAAMEGQGVALAQRVLVEDDLVAGRLVAPLAIELDRGLDTYHLVWDAGNPQRNAVERLEQWLTGVCYPPAHPL